MEVKFLKNQTKMDNTHLDGLYSVLDSQIEANLRRLNILYERSINYSENEYENIAINSKIVFNDYSIIRKRESKLRRKFYNGFNIVDFGCGIGNVLQILDGLMSSDQKLFTDIDHKSILGVDKIKCYLTFAENRLPSIAKLVQDDMSDPATLNRILVQNYRKPVDTELNIWYCNRPFKNFDLQRWFETELINRAKVGTYLINPMGFSILPRIGIIPIHKGLYKKTKRGEIA
jgi:hypothetical protein